MNTIMTTQNNQEKIAHSLHAIANSKDGSIQQRNYFNRLFSQTNSLFICKDTRFTPEDRDEAANLTRMAICGLDRDDQMNAKLIRKLVDSSPKYLVSGYNAVVKGILKHKAVDVLKKNLRHLSLDAKISSDSEETFVDLIANEDLTGLDLLIEGEEKEAIAAFIQYINSDPEDIFKTCHPKGYPQCNAQVLLKERFLNESSKTWRELAEEVKTPVGTMTGRFFYPKCLPLLQQTAQKFVSL